MSACGGSTPAAAPGPAVPAVTAAPTTGPAAAPGPAAPPKPGKARPDRSAAAAQRLLDAAAAKLRTAKTGRLTWTAELASDTGRLTQQARNSYDLAADRWAAQVTVRAEAGELAFDWAAAGDKLYVTFKQGMPKQLDGRWLGLARADVPELETGRSVVRALDALRASGSRAAGGGTSVRGTLPAARALDLLALSGVPDLAGRRVDGTAAVDVRLDSAGRVVGLTMDGADVRLEGPVPASVRRSVAGSRLSVEFGGFGSAVTVRTPKTWTPVDAADLPGH